jgi:hypothetical protein
MFNRSTRVHAFDVQNMYTNVAERDIINLIINILTNNFNKRVQNETCHIL